MGVEFWEVKSLAVPGGPGELTGIVAGTPNLGGNRLHQASEIPGISGDTYSSNVWDVVFIDDTPLPGVCDVKGIAQLKLDDKKAKGQHGSNLTVTGYQPGPFEISCLVWTPIQLSILEDLIDNVWNIPRAGNPSKADLKKKLRKARTCSHPVLDMLKIAFCEFQGIAFPEDGPVSGSKIWRFKCNEVKPPGKKDVSRTAKASGPKRAFDYRDLDKPENVAPKAPSTNPKNLRPGGRPTPPASGPD